MASHSQHQAHPTLGQLTKNFVILGVLMGATILAFRVDFGHIISGFLPFPDKDVAGSYINNIIAVTIAVIKAYCVVNIFMGVKYAGPITKMWAWAGFVWFPMMLIIFGDYTTRHWEYNVGWVSNASDLTPKRSTLDESVKILNEKNAYKHDKKDHKEGH
jgi:caa(3)-type oxidase subunit IV